jgi:hypothetical protein
MTEGEIAEQVPAREYMADDYGLSISAKDALKLLRE